MVIKIKTEKKTQLIDITDRVAKAVAGLGIASGAVLVYVPHTTAGVTINEAADPSVAGDIVMALDMMVPDTAPYRHMEGNSPAHVKSSMVGASQIVAIEEGQLVLGTWQGIFFCEFDGPRTRKVMVKGM